MSKDSAKCEKCMKYKSKYYLTMNELERVLSINGGGRQPDMKKDNNPNKDHKPNKDNNPNKDHEPKKHRAQRFLHLSRTAPQEDSSNSAPTVLLSCKEFEDVIDKIIIRDSNCVVKRNAGTEEIININSLRALHEEDSKKSIIIREKYEKFCEQTGLTPYVDKEKATYHDGSAGIYLRKINKLSSEKFYRGFIRWNVYGDLTPDIKMDRSTVSQLRGAKVIFFAYFSFKENVTPIMNQLIFLNSLAHYGVDDLTIVLPFFPVGTMERIVGEGEIPTAYALANILNSIPNGAGKNKLIVFDIHALCSRFFFTGNLRPILISALPSFIDYINKGFAGENNIVVFPDDGAKKRFEKILQSIDELIGTKTKTILCSKARQDDERIIKIESGLEHIDERSKTNLFLIDDLVQSGGTIGETLKGIRSYIKNTKPDAKKISYNVMITHSVFPSDDKFHALFSDDMIKSAGEEKGDRINKFITTNTLPSRVEALNNILNDNEYGKENPRFKIIEIADILFDVITNEKTTRFITPYILN